MKGEERVGDEKGAENFRRGQSAKKEKKKVDFGEN